MEEPRQAGVLISKRTLCIKEGGLCDFYHVSLCAPCERDVEILIKTDEIQMRAYPKVLRFTPRTWDQPNVVRIEAQDDATNFEGVARSEPLEAHTSYSVIEHQMLTVDPTYRALGDEIFRFVNAGGVTNLPIETSSRRQLLNQVGRRNKGKGAGAHLAPLACSIMVRVLDNDGRHLYSFGDGLFGELGSSKVAIQHTPECVCFNEIKVRVKHKAREKPNERQTFKSEQ
jgi:hypothetical protein